MSENIVCFLILDGFIVKKTTTLTCIYCYDFQFVIQIKRIGEHRIVISISVIYAEMRL